MVKYCLMSKTKKVYIKTFGCAQNTADSERIKTYYWEKGFETTENWKEADEVVINTCVIRESAENRAWGLIDTINSQESKSLKVKRPKIVITGCAVGAYGKRDIKGVDEWKNIGEFLVWEPARDKKKAAFISISTGCNNHCSYCIVPKARGEEVSRKMDEILLEAEKAIENGFEEVLLIGQNVNSYGADLTEDAYVNMGKKRFKSLFPQLLDKVASKNFKKVSFVSSNPWDFSDELIETIAKHPNIDRLLHLPFQSGDDEVLKKMNRGYTKQEYLNLVSRIKSKVAGVKFSTDIIIGFPGEDEAAFQNTIDVCNQVGFEIAYINKYSPRKGTISAKVLKNDVPQKEKRRRWVVLNELVNK